MVSRPPLLRLSYAQKLSLVAAIPLILAVAAIAFLVAVQARATAEREIRALESQLIAAKKAELRNYVTQARNGFYFIYGNAAQDDQEAKDQVTQILSAMIYGTDGFFFVYDYDGNNLVSPRQTELIGKNHAGMTDIHGTPIVDEMIRLARDGSGHLEYYWPKPSTGEQARMISYVLGFQDWRWAVGTGVYIDDILATVAAARAEVEAQVRQTFIYLGVITLLAMLLVFASGMLINLRERRLADAKLKRLTQRVFDAQEEERGRVARELHDGISQILVGVRYALDTARVLDDLGLGPALKSLTDEFSQRTGIPCTFDTVVFRNRLDNEAKIALYRIAQEALTNIERHSDATEITMDLRGHRAGATLRITDNGQGLNPYQRTQGLGLRNMQERMEQLGGRLHLGAPRGGKGLMIEAHIPLTHLLPPEDAPAPVRGIAAQ